MRVALVSSCNLLIQRVVRGFIGRRRRRFLQDLKSKVLRLQAAARQIKVRNDFAKQRLRREWAANTIQRSVRGLIARRRVQTRIQSIQQVGLWLLERKRNQWDMERLVRATCAVQRIIRRFIRRCKLLKAVSLREQREAVAERMAAALRSEELRKAIYRKQLQQWYVDQKKEYDLSVLTETQTKEQKRLILRRRQAQVAATVELKHESMEAKRAREEAERVHRWLLSWQETEDRRAEARRVECWQAIETPATNDEKALRKELKARAKKHVKDVLRRCRASPATVWQLI